MIKSDKIEKMYVFNLGGKEYHIIGRLVAYYLAKLKLSKENYNSIEEADRLLWNHYSFYINNPKQCESEVKKNIKYIVSSYKEFFKPNNH